jgi:hypothetical protein
LQNAARRQQGAGDIARGLFLDSPRRREAADGRPPKLLEAVGRYVVGFDNLGGRGHLIGLGHVAVGSIVDDPNSAGQFGDIPRNPQRLAVRSEKK